MSGFACEVRSSNRPSLEIGTVGTGERMKNSFYLAAITLVGLAAVSPPGAAQPSASGDFNNDGVADLAIGVPNETRQSRRFDTGCFCLVTTNHPGAGAVNIVFGSTGGLTTAGSHVAAEDALGVTSNTHFGTALAAGKFRGPSFASDLAVFVPGQVKGGAIEIVFSGSGKLNNTPSQTFFAEEFSGAGTALGSNPLDFPPDLSLARGDFNGDQAADLAVEIVNGGVNHANSNSAVLIFYGTATSGFSKTNTTLLVVNDALKPDRIYRPGCGVSRVCGRADGHVGLAAADLDGDGRDELLIGTPGIRERNDFDDEIGSGSRAGVLIVPGNSSGLSQYSGWNFVRSSTVGGEFGSALAVGDFNADQRKDIAVGAPGLAAGFVQVFMGNTFPLTFSNTFVLRQSDSGTNLNESLDHFGATLAAVDLDGNGASELAVGAPGQAEGNTAGVGAVTVFFGTVGGGLQAGARPTFMQRPLVAAFGVTCCFANTGFGSSLIAANFGVGPPGDLVIGSPSFGMLQIQGNQVVPFAAAGSALALYGATSTGIIAAPGFMQLWTQNTPFDVCPAGLCLKTADAFAPGNHFGAALR
jgi:hypothetical protein